MTSAVTTAWGVNWDEIYIARDLMQNFFDANRDRLEAVKVLQANLHGRQEVIISAPSPFNLERLFYLGSEKSDDDIGQYGEGFKVAATCLLRDHNIMPVVISGNDVVCLRVADKSVADTQLYPVEYDFYHNQNSYAGTALLLHGCSMKLARALAQGLSHFFYPENPLLGEKLWMSHDGSFSMYASVEHSGHIFYRKLKRGEINDLPIVLVIDKQFEKIEKKISKDRDRNAFGEEMMKLFYNHFARYGIKHSHDGQKILLESARHCWEKGHPLLSEIADAQNRHGNWSRAEGQVVFGDKYFCRSNLNSHYSRLVHNNLSDQLGIERIEKTWREQGKIALPAYFSHFGVISALDELLESRKKALEDDIRKNRRAPSTGEMEAIILLQQTCNELAPEMMAVFSRGDTAYTVARTETILGEMKSGRGYYSREVFLAESVFEADFADALAIFIHEHTHIFGHDGSRGFSDALTGLLAEVIRYRQLLDSYESSWEDARSKVMRERWLSPNRDEDDLKDWLENLDPESLRGLVESLPPTVLRKLRGKREHTEERIDTALPRRIAVPPPSPNASVVRPTVALPRRPFRLDPD
jgi:hypothetical protein